jgi:hypothetical protein
MLDRQLFSNLSWVGKARHFDAIAAAAAVNQSPESQGKTSREP